MVFKLIKVVTVLFILPLFLLISSCTKTHLEKVARPLGFEIYSEGQVANGKKNLFFFHVHHCPNCHLTIKHLIKTKEFQSLTKSYNRYHIEMGRSSLKNLSKRYGVHGGPVFVVADENFNLISRSSYGFMGLTEFATWLQTGKVEMDEVEKRGIHKLLNKYFTGESPANFGGLYKVFQLALAKKDEIGPERLKTFYFDSLQILRQRLSKGPEVRDKYGLYYDLCLSFWNLADIEREIYKNDGQRSLKEALRLIKKIDSGDVIDDYGAYTMQIALNISLKNNVEVARLEKLIVSEEPDNLVLLYSTLAHSHLFYGKDCAKVFHYTNKIPLSEIPVHTERLNFIALRIECHEMNRDFRSAQKDFNLLMEKTSPEIRQAFPEKLKKITDVMDRLSRSNKKTRTL